MTLSDSKVKTFLKNYFVVGWTNISGKVPYAGTSNTHLPTYSARLTTNCAGHHNVQLFFMTTDGRVVHCLPGFWEPKAFLSEARLAVELVRLDQRSLSAADRYEKYLDLHLAHAIDHDDSTRRASAHQGFDAQNLARRQDTDFQRQAGFTQGGLKLPDQVLHERMAERPYLPFESFDTAAYIDMGIKQFRYDTEETRSNRSPDR